MKTESARCYYCGQAIRLVAVGGVIRPFHKSGACCAKSKRRAKKAALGDPMPFPVVFPPAFENPVERHTCACGNEAMYLVRHKDGVLAFDRLDWPWKRHECPRTTLADYGIDHLCRKLSERAGLRPRLALIAGSQKGWGVNASHLAAVQELGEGGSKFCLKLRGEELPEPVKQKERIDAGALVALCRNGEVRHLMTTSGFEFECIDSHCWPEELGIPIEWIDPEAILI